MTDNIFDFAQTNQALGSLSEIVVRVETALKTKQNALLEEQKEQKTLLNLRNKQLEELKMASSNVVQNIDSIINSLDSVLEDNGSGNNNN